MVAACAGASPQEEVRKLTVNAEEDDRSEGHTTAEAVVARFLIKGAAWMMRIWSRFL